MTIEELNIIVNGLNDHMRAFVSFDDAESNNIIKNGWFTEDDILNFGISIDDD